jgi:hypothetical protein
MSYVTTVIEYPGTDYATLKFVDVKWRTDSVEFASSSPSGDVEVCFDNGDRTSSLHLDQVQLKQLIEHLKAQIK